MRRLLLVAFLLLVACDGGVYADGMVRGEDGRPIPGATVLLEQSSDGWRFTGMSERDGSFGAGGVTAPGHRREAIRVEAPGFKPATGRVKTLHANCLAVTLARTESAGASRIEEVPETACRRR